MKARGFTLVEMVLTMVVSGIIVLGISGFLEFGVSGYSDTIERQKIQNQARFVVEKLSREIRHAVPNSFSLSSGDKCLSFYPIKYSGFYTRDEDSGNLLFLVDNQAATASFASGDRMVINPSRADDLLSSSSASASVAECSTSDAGCSETNGIYSVSDSFSSYSVSNRHFVYQSSAVTYCITSSGTVVRNTVTVADGIDYSGSGFSYDSATLQRGGLVHLSFLFINQGERSHYKHDVQVLNVP